MGIGCIICSAMVKVWRTTNTLTLTIVILSSGGSQRRKLRREARGGVRGGEGESNGEAGNEDGGADADTSDSAEPTETAPKEHPPDGRCGRRRILWRVDRRTRWRRKAEEYKKRLPGGCLPGMSSGGVLMSNEELWDARLLAKSCLVAEEEPETRHKRLFRKRLPDELAPKWTQLDEAVETELKLSRAMAAGAPLPPPKHPRPHLPSVASATADGAMAGREVIAGGWHLPYDTSSTPYWSARAAPQLGPEAVRDAAAAMGGAGVKGNDNGSGSGGAGVAARRGTAQFGFRIKVHSSRLDGISVQEARARAARLYRTGSSGQMGSDRSSSICSSNGEDCSSDSSSSGEMADPDGDEGQAAAVMAAEEGDEGLGAGICLRHQRSGKAGLHASARVRKVDELLAVPDPECDDGVGPADDVRLERANTAFFDEYFWEQSRTVQKQYDYTVRDGSSTSRPSSQGLGYRQRWLFAHWELTLRCTHPGCGAEKLIHLPAAVPGRLTLEELAASGLRVWVVRPEGNRGEHNHAPPGGGGVLWRSGRPLSELHRLVPEGLQVDMPLATMLPIPLPHQQQLPAAGPSEGAANVTVAADDTRCGGIPPSFHSVPPSQRAAAAVWLLEPPSPPVWKCRGWIWKPREPGGRPQLTICGAINRAGDWAAAGNTGAAGLAGSAKTGLSGSFSGNSCGSCGSCRPDGRHGMLRQLVSAALDQHDPASVTPLQLHGHVAMATSVSGGGVPPMFSLPEVAADAFVVLMQRIARALLHHHLPPLLPQPPPPPSLLLLTPPSGDHTNVEVLNTVVKPIVDAVVKSAAWSWPGITLLHAELGASPPDVAAICAARAFGGLKARKVARKDIIEDPERFVMGDDDCLELQRAAGVLGVAGGSGGGGGSGPPPVDVEEVGDWHMPLAFRQLQRRIAETYSVSVTAKALAEEVAANAVGTQAASEMTTRAADDAARPCSHHQSTMQTQTSRISQVAEVASHAVMALLCSLEAPADLRDQQKSVWLRPEVILGDPYGSSPSGGPFADGALANQRTIFVGGGGRLAPGANGVGCDGDVGLKESRTRSERSESQNGSGFEPGPAPRLALDTAQLLQPELQKHCPQVAALVAPLAPRAEPSIGGDAAAGMLGNAGHSNAVTGGSGIATAAGDAQPAAYVARRRDALAWDDPQAVQPALELCGPAVRVHNPDVDGLRDHPMGMPYMVSVLAKRRRLNSEHVGVGVGSSDKGAYNLCRQEWFYHCLRQQLHPECESFGGPVGQQAGLQLHATGPLHWLPKAANQQAAAEAAAAAVLQTGVAATTSHEGLAVMLRSAVHGGDCHRGRGATAGDDVSTTAMATAAAAGAQLDLLSSSLVAPVPDRQLAAAAIAASVGQRTPAAAAPVITLVPPPAAIKYHANIALARGAMSPPAIRPIFHRRGIPTSTVTLVVQFSIAWASRQRAAMLPAQHVPMPKRRRKKLPGPPVHPPWALESTPMGDPWDIAGIEAVQQTGSVASCDDGQRDDANGGDNRDGSKLTQRLLRAAADAVEADSGLNTSARGAGSFPGYAWRPWVSVTERRTPGSNEDARAANVAQKGQRVEGYSSRQMPGAGKRKLKAGPQHETVAAAGAPAAASGAGSGANASGSGAAQATDECSPLPPSIVMVEELARRSIFSGRADLSARAQARFRAVVQMRGSVLQPGGARGGSGQGN
ncbi:hypothetical protein Vretifemale_7766 [Volvox reticuliferus]|nr:hypothetical protein Vretifemale_7766 [Volvox reticuliferus]